MKKALFIIAVAAAFGLAGCEPKATNANQNDAGNPQETVAEETVESQEIGKCLLYQGDGKLNIYDIATHTNHVCEGEIGEIIDFVSTSAGKVYYNVKENGRLILKSIDLKDLADPVALSDWGINLDVRDSDYIWPYGKMYLKEDETQIGLETDKMYYAGSFYNNLAVYDIATGGIKTYELYRLFDDMPEDVPSNTNFFVNDEEGGPTGIDYSQFVDEEGLLYYLGHPAVDGSHPCLNDKIDYEEYFGFDPTMVEFTADFVSLDPKGERALVFYNGVLGDGIVGVYSVSTLDGKTQILLPETGDGSDPEWLDDGSLVYIGFGDDPVLRLMDTDGTFHTIGKAYKYMLVQ